MAAATAHEQPADAMSFSIPVGEHGPTLVILIVLAIFWTMILFEQRRRRRRAAAGLPIFGPAVRTEGAEGTGPVRQSLPLSREVLDHFRATGPGWPARIDEVLKRHVREEEERARRRVEEAEGAKARVAEERGAFRGKGEEGES
ncbi:MAG TPA: BrnA antitoxin family protein [Sphingomicrobium sp.]